MLISEAFFSCHDVLILVKSPIKGRQRPVMTIAVDWGVKHPITISKTTMSFGHRMTFTSYSFLLFVSFGDYFKTKFN